MKTTTQTTLDTIRRRSLDGFPVLIEGGSLGDIRSSYTRHAPLSTMADVLTLAECVSLFDRAEMPALSAAAATLAKRGPLEVWSLVKKATELSHKAGTRPADMPAPERTVEIAVWTPQQQALRAAGYIVAPSSRKVTI